MEHKKTEGQNSEKPKIRKYKTQMLFPSSILTKTPQYV
jgi:hypothetical protein